MIDIINLVLLWYQPQQYEKPPQQYEKPPQHKNQPKD